MTQTFDRDLLASMRQDLHRLAVRLGAASELFRRGLGEEAAPDLQRCVNLVDDLGLTLDDMLAVDADVTAPLALPPAPPSPPRRPKAPRIITPPPAVVPPAAAATPDDDPDDEDDDGEDDVVPEPLAVVPDVDEEEPPPSAVATGDEEVIGEWSVRTIRGRRFVRCPEFVCAKRVWLDPHDKTPAEVEQAISGHRMTGEHKAPPPAAAGRKR